LLWFVVAVLLLDVLVVHNTGQNNPIFGNSLDKLRHTRSVACLVELVLLNKHQVSGGGPYLDCYPIFTPVVVE